MFFSSPHPTIHTRIGMSALALVFVGFFAGLWSDFTVGDIQSIQPVDATS